MRRIYATPCLVYVDAHDPRGQQGTALKSDPHWNVCTVCGKPRGRGRSHESCSLKLKASLEAENDGTADKRARAGKSAARHYRNPRVTQWFSDSMGD